MEEVKWFKIPRPAPRAGKRWSPEEDAYLLKAVRRGDSVERLCDLLGRPWSGTVSRLVHLGILRFVRQQVCYEWNYPRAHRRGNVSRERELPLRVTSTEMNQFRRFFRNFK